MIPSVMASNRVVNRRGLAGLLAVGLLSACLSGSGAKGGAGGSGPAGSSAGTGGAGGLAGGAGVATVAVTPVGTATGTPSQMLVPAAGGTVTSVDGKLKIDVPAGALAADQMLMIQPITSKAPGGVGPAYRLQPDGQTFAVPVTLTFTYDAADLAGSVALAWRIAYQDAMGRWNSVTNVVRDDAAMTVSVQTSHFSDWSKLLALRLTPERAAVKAGDVVPLAALACEVSMTTMGDDPLAELLDTCEPDPKLSSLSGWAANEIPDGDAANGTIASSSVISANYTAPATAPTPNPVRVSVNALDTSGHTTVLASEITWLGDNDHPSYKGNVTSTKTVADLGFVTTTTADVTFVWDIVNGWYNVGEGTMSAIRDLNSKGCVGHWTYQGDLVARDGQILVNSGTYLAEGSKMGDLVGTNGCGGASEASTVTDDIQWWPPSLELFFVKPDGSLEDGFDEVNAQTGVENKAQWLFVRVP
jgi:hypothetical protein